MKSRFLFVIIVIFSLGQSYSQQEFQSLFNTKMKEGCPKGGVVFPHSAKGRDKPCPYNRG